MKNENETPEADTLSPLDVMAIAALPAVIRSRPSSYPDEVARDAYNVAASMLIERARRGSRV